MKKLFLLIFLFVFIGVSSLWAQTRVITGTIASSVEAEGPIPGVTVQVKGTTIGAVTDVNGKYSISAPQNATHLVFSYIGMKSQEVAISGRSVIDGIMESDILGLDEVVVTALGISRAKKSLGYSVSEVKGDEVATVKNNDFVQSLSGKVAGLQIRSNTNFGGSTNVIIRGSSSLTGNNQALFVIDGIPVDNSILNSSYQKTGGHGYDYGNTGADINPNDVESISVLKGAAATALYGSRAANGVILITTKKGTPGKALGVSYSGNLTIGTIDRSTFPKYQKEYGGGYGLDWYSASDRPGLEYWDWNGDGTEEYIDPTYEDASMGEPFDPSLNVYQWNSFIPGLDTYGKALPWVGAEHDPADFFEKALSMSHSFDVSGGSEKATYRFSYQNLSQTGLMPNSKLDKNNFSLTGTFDITRKIKVTSYANYVTTKTKGRNSTGYSGNILSMFRQWYQVNVDVEDLKNAYEKTGTNATWNMNAPDNLSPAYWDNPYWDRYRNFQTDGRNRFIGYAKVDWIATNFMTVSARAAIDNYSYLQEERRAIGSIPEAFGVGLPDAASGYSVTRGDFVESNFDLMASFKKDFSANLNLTGLVGTNIRQRIESSIWSSTNGGLAVPDIYSMANTISPLELPEEDASKILVNGYFANASLGIHNMLFLEGSVRVDQSSTLPINNDTYVYPSASASFIFTELINSPIFSLGKLRLNYAEVGNDAPFASLHDVYYQKFPFDGQGVAYGSSTKMNPELKSERTKSIEAGLTLNLLNNRVGLDFAVYDNRTVDQIMPVAISYATGYRYKYVNSGEVSNKGVELMLNLIPVQINNFNWDMNLNWAKNVSEVISLDEGVENLQLASLQGGVTINARVGEPLGTIQGTDYEYYNNIKTPENRLIEAGTYLTTSTSDQVIGNVNPDWTAGLRNTFSYKNLDLSFLIDWRHGGDLFSLDLWYGASTGLYPESAGLNDLGNPYRNYVTGDEATDGGIVLQGKLADGSVNTERSDQMGTYYTPIGSAYAPNAMFIYDASFVKMREISITYRLPRTILAKTFINDLSLSFVGSNLWIIHKNLPYADPETTQGAGNIQGWQSGVMPSTRNFGFSLNVNF